MYVISVLPTLQLLDDTPITDDQRKLAFANKRSYAMSGGPLKFIEKFGSTMFLNMFKTGKETSKLATGELGDDELTAQPSSSRNKNH